MLLVPRQLQRVGLTGDIPYYGGRLTPAQAYAASHPSPATRAAAISPVLRRTHDTGADVCGFSRSPTESA